MLLRPQDLDRSGTIGVTLGRETALLSWEERKPRSGLLTVAIGDRPAPRPYVAITLDVSTHTVPPKRRCYLALRLPPESGNGEPITIRDGSGETLAIIDTPLAHGASDASALTDILAPTERGRLGRFLLDTCVPTFRLARDSDFQNLMQRLAAASPDRGHAFAPTARLTDRYELLVGTMPRLPSRGDAVYLLAGGTIFRNPFSFEQLASTAGTSAPTGALIVDGLAPEHGQATAIFCLDDGLAAVPIAAARPAAPRYHDLLQQGGKIPGILRDYVLRALATGAAGDPAATALVAEAQVLAPRKPRHYGDPTKPIGAGLELAVGLDDGGVFLKGWLRDPLGLIGGLTVLSPFGDRTIEPGQLHRIPRPDIDTLFAESPFKMSGAPADAALGFVALVPGPIEPARVRQYGLRLDLKSGARLDLRATLRVMSPLDARNAVLGSVPASALKPAMLENCIGPAAAALHRDTMANRSASETITIGTLPEQPVVSMIIPIYRNLSFLRFQLAAFALDPAMRDVETIFVLDSPEQRAEVEHLLRGLHLLYGQGMKLVVQPRNFGFSAANNSGAAVARGHYTLHLNSDVVPEAPGWLLALVDALDRDPVLGAVGAKLLFDDGSLQHAGLFFERDEKGEWYNNHYFKGYPRDFAPAAIARRVPGVTGAAVLVRRSLYEAIGGFTEDYIIGDYEDSDFCLKIRAAGYEIGYVPEAELVHFERRSMELHAGYARTVACSYNRWLHAGRWSDAMASLMDGTAIAASTSRSDATTTDAALKRSRRSGDRTGSADRAA